MNTIRLKGRAKINLTLDILGKRPDHYHEVEMVMQSIDLYDILEIREAADGIEVTTDQPALAGGPENIAFRAARLMLETVGYSKGVQVHIQKQIPIAAGLAGGSADAAAVLRGLNRMWGLGLTEGDLMNLGASIGSDVPFCIMQGTALAKGRGEILTRLPDLPRLWLVLAKPPLEVSTAEVYRHFDLSRVRRRPGTVEMLRAVETGQPEQIRNQLVNVLESVTLERYPVVRELKEAMAEIGLAQPLMSGSGPTMFGIADDPVQAEEIARKLQKMFPGAYTGVTRTWSAQEQDFPDWE